MEEEGGCSFVKEGAGNGRGRELQFVKDIGGGVASGTWSDKAIYINLTKMSWHKNNEGPETN